MWPLIDVIKCCEVLSYFNSSILVKTVCHVSVLLKSEILNLLGT